MAVAFVRYRHLLPLGGVLLVAGGLYVRLVFKGFWSDDIISMNQFQDSSALGYMKDALDFRHRPPPPPMGFYRPFHSGAMLGLYEVFGLRAGAFHLASVGLHLLNTVLVWVVTARLTRRRLVAGLAAGLFALHPAYVEAIAWISNGGSLLATSASLLSFWCFMKADDAPRRRLWYGSSLVFYSASLLFHPESGVIVLVLATYRLMGVSGGGRQAYWKAATDLLPFVVPGILYFAVHRWMVNQDYFLFSDQFALGAHMYRQYLGYFAMLAYPRAPISLGVTFPSVAYKVGASILIAGLVLLVISNRRRLSPGHLAVIWLIAAIFPLSTFDLLLLSPAMWGRKLYAAGPPFALVFALLAAPAIEMVVASGRRLAQASAVAAGLALASLAGFQIVQHQESVTYYADQNQSFVAQLKKRVP